MNPLEGFALVRWERRKLGIRRPWFKLGLEADLLRDLEIPLLPSGSVSLTSSVTLQISNWFVDRWLKLKGLGELVCGRALPARF